MDFIKYILAAIFYMLSSFYIMIYVCLKKKMDATLSLSLRGRHTHLSPEFVGDTA